MPAPDDGQPNWDDESPSANTPPARAKRVRTELRPRDHDVVAEVVDGTDGDGGAWKPLLAVGAAVLLALGLILGVVRVTAPPKVDPTTADPPRVAGRPELPYTPGTQTVLKELDRIPTVARDGVQLVAAEPLGVVAFLSTPNFGGLQLYDLATKKKLPVGSPVFVTQALLTPPDRSALFVHDGPQKVLYRLNAAQTGWDRNELPAGTRDVLPLSRETWIAVVEDGLGAANVTVHEMAWGDRKPATAKTAKPNRMLFTAWVGPNGRLAAIGPGPGLDKHLLEFAFGEKELTVVRDHKIATHIGTYRTYRPSWDGRQLFHPGMELYLEVNGDTVTERKPPAPLIAGSRDLLFATTGEYFTHDGKPAGQLGFVLRGADVTPDGKAVWVMDNAKNELVKYSLTDGR